MTKLEARVLLRRAASFFVRLRDQTPLPLSTMEETRYLGTELELLACSEFLSEVAPAPVGVAVPIEPQSTLLAEHESLDARLLKLEQVIALQVQQDALSKRQAERSREVTGLWLHDGDPGNDPQYQALEQEMLGLVAKRRELYGQIAQAYAAATALQQPTETTEPGKKDQARRDQESARTMLERCHRDRGF